MNFTDSSHISSEYSLIKKLRPSYKSYSHESPSYINFLDYIRDSLLLFSIISAISSNPFRVIFSSVTNWIIHNRYCCFLFEFKWLADHSIIIGARWKPTASDIFLRGWHSSLEWNNGSLITFSVSFPFWRR